MPNNLHPPFTMFESVEPTLCGSHVTITDGNNETVLEVVVSTHDEDTYANEVAEALNAYATPCERVDTGYGPYCATHSYKGQPGYFLKTGSEVCDAAQPEARRKREEQERIVKANERMLTALREIVKGVGPYNRDNRIHASNTIDAMKAIAQAAIDAAEKES